jgi:hypothetical protein
MHDGGPFFARSSLLVALGCDFAGLVPDEDGLTSAAHWHAKAFAIEFAPAVAADDERVAPRPRASVPLVPIV